MNGNTTSFWCLVLIVASAPLGAPAATGAGIAWDAYRPLTWDDFTGPVAGGAEPQRVAMTAASLGWAYRYALEWSGGSCVYRITEIRASAVFDPAKSWVRPGHRTATVLEHEQGHFDITQLYVHEFEDRTREFIGAAAACKGKNERRISSFVEREVAQRIGSVYEQIWRDYLNTQESYDSDTGHGTNPAAQAQWLEKIAEGLRSRSPETVGAASIDH